MHLSPPLVHLGSLKCNLVVRVIPGLTEDLPAQDQCIQTGEVEDPGEVPATQLGHPTLRPPRLFLATHSKEHRQDGLQDFLVRVHMVVQVQHRHMVDLLVDQDPDHMVHNTVRDPGLTLGQDLQDREQDHLTDLT